MISLNFTLICQFVLFLIFLWGANTMVFRPLLKVMDDRKAKVENDRAVAEAETREVQELDSVYTRRLAEAHQAAAQRLHQARHDVYQRNRDFLEAQKRKADAEVASVRAAMDARIEAERQKFPELLPGIVEAIDRQIDAEGSLL